MNNLMRLFQRTNGGSKWRTFTWWWWWWWWVSVTSTAALFWATVSFCCQSLKAKEHIHQLEDWWRLYLLFLFFYSFTRLSPPFSKVFYSVGSTLTNEHTPPRQAAAGASTVIISRQYTKCVGFYFAFTLTFSRHTEMEYVFINFTLNELKITLFYAIDILITPSTNRCGWTAALIPDQKCVWTSISTQSVSFTFC